MTKKKSDSDISSPRKLSSLAFICILVMIFILWMLILKPFIPVFAGSLALSVIAYPLFVKINKWFPNKILASALTILLFACLIVAPLIFVTRELLGTVVENAEYFNGELTKNGGTDNIIGNVLPGKLGRYFSSDIKNGLEDLTSSITSGVPAFLTSSIWSLVQILLIFFTSFFFLRDKKEMLSAISEYLPLTNSESKKVFKEIDDTIHATVFGNIITSMIQGALGGIMFWILGIPGAVLWGFVMMLLSMLPSAGSFLVWAPAAFFLALQGKWVDSVILSVWGTFAIGLIDNILYPILVGQRVQLHTLTLFFAILGGVLFFGASGIILGPVILALGQSLIQIWKDRPSTSKA